MDESLFYCRIDEILGLTLYHTHTDTQACVCVSVFAVWLAMNLTQTNVVLFECVRRAHMGQTPLLYHQRIRSDQLQWLRGDPSASERVWRVHDVKHNNHAACVCASQNTYTHTGSENECTKQTRKNGRRHSTSTYVHGKPMSGSHSIHWFFSIIVQREREKRRTHTFKWARTRSM